MRRRRRPSGRRAGEAPPPRHRPRRLTSGRSPRTRGSGRLQGQVADLKDKIAGVRHLTSRSSDPARQTHERQLVLVQRELQSLLTYLARDPSSLPGVDGAGLAGTTLGAIQQRRDRLAVLKLMDEALAGDIEQFEEDSRRMARNTLDLHEQQDEYELADATAKKVGGEIQAIEVELKARPRVELLDMAKTPLTKDDSKKVKMAGMAGMGSFALVLAGITLMEYRARRVSSEQDVVRNLGIRLVGVLPAVPKREPRRIRNATGSHSGNWRSALIESVDATRTMLLHAAHTHSIRVVMITSALKGEGKSSLSSQLATSLARGGLKTILIDCDFRRSALHKLFDVPNEPGLCDLLRGDVALCDVIQPTTIDGLSLITAGGCDPLALQALALGGARRSSTTSRRTSISWSSTRRRCCRWRTPCWWASRSMPFSSRSSAT